MHEPGDVKTASEYTGGIIGRRLTGGVLEYCVNYGEVVGSASVGGIVGGEVEPENIILGCLNNGSVTCSGKFGGIVGEILRGDKVYGCMNTGAVNSKIFAGGIAGSGNCCYSFNTGRVESGSKAGAISGKGSEFSFCRALKGTGSVLCAEGEENGAKWCTAKEAADGTCCFELNGAGEKLKLDGFAPGLKYIFGQSIGMDDAPVLTGIEVIRDGDGSFGNEYHEVRVEYNRAYGKVTGAGQYTDGRQVKLSAKPKAGYVFDHYVIGTANTLLKETADGKKVGQSAVVRTDKKANVTIAKKINRSYNVKAVFVPKTVKLDEGTAGDAEVGYLESDGSFNVEATKSTPAEAWEYAQELAGVQNNKKKAAIWLKGIWTLKQRLSLAGNMAVTVDLNVYTIRRDLKTAIPQDDGAVFHVSRNADLKIIDSNPDRKCHPEYKGGVIEGGRSSSSVGLFRVEGTHCP